MSRKFSTAVLDTLLKTVEVEFKVPLLGFGEIKLPVSEYAKEWWKNKKAQEDLLNAINVAEQRFVAENPENKAAQILHDFSLKNEEEFQRVISELLNHFDERKITWLMAEKLKKGFENIISNKELKNALNDYIPYLRDELSSIREFREVITYLLQKQIATTTSLTYETTQEIKDLLLKQQTPKIENQPNYVPEVLTDIDKLPEPSDFLPPGSRMPFYRNKIFTGRESDLIDLAKVLSSHFGTPKNAIITQLAAAAGIGGIGKTQLAVEFCYRYGKFFHGIHWINARDGNLETEIVACGFEMRLPSFPQTTPEQVFATLQAWKTHPLRLIIFDNLEDPDLLADWLPRLNGLCILVTTRRQKWSPDLGVVIHPIGVLSHYHSLVLLRKLSPRLKDFGDNALEALAERLGNLPLALDLAGRYLNNHLTLSPEDYLKRLEAQENILIHTSLAGWVKEANPTKHETSIASTFLVSLNQLGETLVDQIARGLFIGAGYLAPSSLIPTHLFYALGLMNQFPNNPQNMEQIQEAEELTDEALGLLNNIGLLSENNSIHPLISEFAKLQQDNDKTILSRLNKSFQIFLHSVENEGAASETLPIMLHLQSFIKYLNQLERTDQVDFYRNYGKFLYHLGQYQKAIDVFKGIIKDLEKSGNTNYFVNTLNILGLAYRETGELKMSLAILSRALSIAIENNLQDGQKATVNNLGMTYAALGRYDEAIQCYTIALEGQLEYVLGDRIQDDLPDYIQKQILNTTSNLGLAYQATAQFEAAIKTFKSTIKMGKRLFGNEHPVIARELGNLGLIYRNLSKPELAKQYFTQALQIYEKTLDPNHPDLAVAISNVGLSYQDLGDIDKALSCFEKALEIKEKVFGRLNHHVAIDLHNLGTVFVSKGDHKKGISLILEAIETETRIYGENHYEVAYDYRSLAYVYLSLRNYDKARRMAEKALTIDKVIFKKDDLPLGKDFFHLGIISFRKRQYKRAIRELSASLNILENFFPSDNTEIIAIKDFLDQAQKQSKVYKTKQ